jgi:KDO2-lipid IV(A) lauroyltransferase
MKVLKKTKRYLIYCLVVFLIDIFRKISFKKSYKVAEILSKIFLIAASREKSIMSLNLAYLNKNIDEKKLFNSILKNLSFNFVEFIKFAFLPFSMVKNNVEVEGEEFLKRAYKKGKGVILLTAHIGNWEFLGTYFGKKGYPLNAIYRKPGSELYDKIIRKIRRLNRVKLIENRNAVGDGFKAIRKGEILIILADQKSQDESVKIDFLGKEAPTPKGPAIFGIKTGAEILTAFVIRKKGGFVIKIKNLDYDKDGKIKEKINSILINMNKAYSDIIRKYPSQWVWFHDRWGIF